MLRGPQTTGEIRSRSTNLFNFESLAEVEETIEGLLSKDPQLIVRLPRNAGMKEPRYAHLLCGPVDMDQAETPPLANNTGSNASHIDADKLAAIEEAIAVLRRELQASSGRFRGLPQSNSNSRRETYGTQRKFGVVHRPHKP
jgi:uncharacterized protein YceH (UPF0502 family)